MYLKLNVTFFKKHKFVEPHTISNSPKNLPKIIKFKDAKKQIFIKERAHIQKLLITLSTQSLNQYEQTICCYIDSLKNQSLSLNKFIRIIIRDSSTNPTIDHILQLLPYKSREKIIVQISKIWPYHQCLIKRLRHISYLVNFCERIFSEKSFLSIMPKHIVAHFILKGK